jgi:hypothetical protein
MLRPSLKINKTYLTTIGIKKVIEINGRTVKLEKRQGGTLVMDRALFVPKIIREYTDPGIRTTPRRNYDSEV